MGGAGYLYVIRQEPGALTDRQGFLYVKVGQSNAPKSRFRSLQTGCPFKLELVAYCRGLAPVEPLAHSDLARWHVRGEWFALSPRKYEQLLEALRDLARRKGLEWWNMSYTSWEEIDGELDLIEQGDFGAMVDIYLRFEDRPMLIDGRQHRVNVTNFSQHVGLPRHRMVSLVGALRGRQTA